MPTVTVSRADVSRDAAMEAVRQQLDDSHTVTPRAGSPDVFTVNTSGWSVAKVHMKQVDGATEFHVHGMGIAAGAIQIGYVPRLIINELVIARRVAAAIAAAPGLSGSA
jgi:hypothetical protein